MNAIKRSFFALAPLLMSCLWAFGALAQEAQPPTESIRSNPEDFKPALQLINPRNITDGIPQFSVDQRTITFDSYPCNDCHDDPEQPPNSEVRTLEEDHETINLVHGKGRFWCLTCHHKDNRDYLRSLKNEIISFDESYLLCGQCHFQRQREFFSGGHGKRKHNWQGTKKLTTCTECHNPHVPQIKKRKPLAPPSLRSGLKQTRSINHAPIKPWQAHKANH